MARFDRSFFAEKFVAQETRKAAVVDTHATPAGAVRLVLPWPPTGNHNIKHGGGAHYMTAEHKAFRSAVKTIVAQTRAHMVPAPYSVSVVWYPPDQRRRDSDNVQKPLFDALVAAGIIADDSMKCKRKYEETVVLPTRPRDGSVVITIQGI